MRHITRSILALGTLTGLSAHAQSFTQLTNMPGATRDGAIAFTIGDNVYLGGGLQSKDLYMLDAASGQWMHKHDLPGVLVERWFAAAFVIGDRAFVGLGSDEDTFLKDLWEYDAVNDTWTQRADFPGTARNAVFGFAVDGKGYVCGGVDANYIYSDIVAYDPVNDQWTPMGALPIGPTAFGSAFVIGDSAYVTGGDHGTGETTDLYRFDPATGGWAERAPFIGHARQTAVSFTLNGRGWVGLGQTEYTTALDDLYSYDPVTDSWSEAGHFPGGVRCWGTACNTADKAYIGTGWDFGSHFFNDWWRMDATVGIAEQAPAEPMQLFPVPATDRLSVRLPGTEHATLQVVDDAGRTVRTGTLVQGASDLDLTGLAPGGYTVVAITGRATPLRVHIVKR